jgi:hypothetical protein
MRKLIFTVVVSFVSVYLVAQEPVRYGIIAGVNSSNYSGGFTSSKTGFHVGGFAEIPVFAKNTYFAPSVQLSSKGAEILGLKMSPYYLDIPLHLKYKYPINGDINIFGSTGLTISYGLFGKGETYTINYTSDESYEEKLTTYDLFSGKDATLKRFDVGYGINAGLEISQHYQVSVGYELGLLNADKETDSSNYKNKNLKISVAYLF